MSTTTYSNPTGRPHSGVGVATEFGVSRLCHGRFISGRYTMPVSGTTMVNRLGTATATELRLTAAMVT